MCECAYINSAEKEVRRDDREIRSRRGHTHSSRDACVKHGRVVVVAEEDIYLNARELSWRRFILC